MAGAEFGGAETAFVDICIALHEAGENVVVATRPNDLRVSKLREAGIPVHTLAFGGKVDVFTRWKLTKIIRDFEPDIVQCWMSRAPTKVPRWKQSMDIKPYAVVARMGGYYKMKRYKSADYFVGNTPDIARYIQDQGIDGNNVRHINNYAAVESIETPLSRSDFDTPEDASLLLALGRLHPVKAFDTLIEVLATLEGAYLWIAGEGEERDKLENLAKHLGCHNRVRFLGWRDDRAALFDAADICVFPSRFEPFGNVAIQAWAYRTPLVVSKADGPRQFVRDGEDGLMFDIDDHAGMKAAIERFIDDPKFASKTVEAGFKRYQNEFSKEQCVTQYLDYYHFILESRA